MNKEKADEIMSKVLSHWDTNHGLENCDNEKVFYTYLSLIKSPHEDGLMPVQVIDGNSRKIPMENIILFGLNASEV